MTTLRNALTNALAAGDLSSLADHGVEDLTGDDLRAALEALAASSGASIDAAVTDALAGPDPLAALAEQGPIVDAPISPLGLDAGADIDPDAGLDQLDPADLDFAPLGHTPSDDEAEPVHPDPDDAEMTFGDGAALLEVDEAIADLDDDLSPAAVLDDALDDVMPQDEPLDPFAIGRDVDFDLDDDTTDDDLFD